MSSLGYVTIGALDSNSSGTFYDAVFRAIGSERKFEKGGWIGYGAVGPGKTFADCHTAVCPPHNGKDARAGNGIMIAYKASSPADIKAAHTAGLKAGGTDEGASGFRPADATKGFFAAYLRDPTGNKVCLFCNV